MGDEVMLCPGFLGSFGGFLCLFAFVLHIPSDDTRTSGILQKFTKLPFDKIFILAAPSPPALEML